MLRNIKIQKQIFLKSFKKQYKIFTFPTSTSFKEVLFLKKILIYDKEYQKLKIYS